MDVVAENDSLVGRHVFIFVFCFILDEWKTSEIKEEKNKKFFYMNYSQLV